MPKFITIGYGDRAGYDRTPQPVRDAAHEHDAKLRSEGALMGIAGKPVQVRNLEGAHLETRDGPFMTSALPIAGRRLGRRHPKNLAHALRRRARHC